MPKSLLLLLVMTLSVSAAAQQKREIRVSVQIAADEVVKSQFQSRVTSALRSLGDVVVVNTDYKYRISLVILGLGPEGGRQTGYVASIVVQETEISKDAINRMIDKEVQDGSINSVLKHVCNRGTPAHHSVLTGPNDIEDLSKRIVAEIDAGPFEEFRSIQQSIDDFNKKKNP